MTAQASEKLINNCPGLNVDGFHLFSLHEDDSGRPSDKRVKLPPCILDPNDRVSSTGCYRGFIATIEISCEAKLILRTYEWYRMKLDDPESKVQIIDETLSGNFWLKMKPSFFHSKSLYIPVNNGHVEIDSGKWLRELPVKEPDPFWKSVAKWFSF